MDKEKAVKLIEWMKHTNIEVYSTLLGTFEMPITGKRYTDGELADHLVELHSKAAWAFESILIKAGLDGGDDDNNNSNTEEK